MGVKVESPKQVYKGGHKTEHTGRALKQVQEASGLRDGTFLFVYVHLLLPLLLQLLLGNLFLLRIFLFQSMNNRLLHGETGSCQ